jgi:hypothetical protein
MPPVVGEYPGMGLLQRTRFNLETGTSSPMVGYLPSKQVARVRLPAGACTSNNGLLPPVFAV